jgi:hypothetical protein
MLRFTTFISNIFRFNEYSIKHEENIIIDSVQSELFWSVKFNGVCKYAMNTFEKICCPLEYTFKLLCTLTLPWITMDSDKIRHSMPVWMSL